MTLIIDTLISYLPIIIFFAISLVSSIIIHEAGHLIAAKRCGCKVETFSIGFGKPIFQRKVKGTVYQVCWILLGGYCAIAGELDYSKKKTALTNLKYRQKLYIVLAGVGANFLTAILAFGLFTMFEIEFLYYFGYLSILLGLTNLIPFPAIDGGYPLLFLLEKPLGKKEGIELIQKTIEVGMVFINTLNIVCIIYGIYWVINFVITGRVI